MPEVPWPTREALEAALAAAGKWLVGEAKRPTPSAVLAFADVLKAARKQLALMPEKCDGPWHYGIGRTDTCLVCRGSGKVYPQTFIERVLLALPFYLSEEQLVAVLDALGETP